MAGLLTVEKSKIFLADFCVFFSFHLPGLVKDSLKPKGYVIDLILINRYESSQTLKRRVAVWRGAVNSRFFFVCRMWLLGRLFNGSRRLPHCFKSFLSFGLHDYGVIITSDASYFSPLLPFLSITKYRTKCWLFIGGSTSFTFFLLLYTDRGIVRGSILLIFRSTTSSLGLNPQQI